MPVTTPPEAVFIVSLTGTAAVAAPYFMGFVDAALEDRLVYAWSGGVVDHDEFDAREGGEAVPHGVLAAVSARADRDHFLPAVLVHEAAAPVQGLGRHD